MRVVGLVLYIAAWIAAVWYAFWLSSVDPKTALGGLLLFFFCVAVDHIKCAIRRIIDKDDDCDC